MKYEGALTSREGGKHLINLTTAGKIQGTQWKTSFTSKLNLCPILQHPSAGPPLSRLVSQTSSWGYEQSFLVTQVFRNDPVFVAMLDILILFICRKGFYKTKIPLFNFSSNMENKVFYLERTPQSLCRVLRTFSLICFKNWHQWLLPLDSLLSSSLHIPSPPSWWSSHSFKIERLILIFKSKCYDSIGVYMHMFVKTCVSARV